MKCPCAVRVPSVLSLSHMADGLVLRLFFPHCITLVRCLQKLIHSWSLWHQTDSNRLCNRLLFFWVGCLLYYRVSSPASQDLLGSCRDSLLSSKMKLMGFIAVYLSRLLVSSPFSCVSAACPSVTGHTDL